MDHVRCVVGTPAPPHGLNSRPASKRRQGIAAPAGAKCRLVRNMSNTVRSCGMMRRLPLFLLPLALSSISACGAHVQPESAKGTCSALSGAADAADALEDCLRTVPAGSDLLLPPGRFELRRPILIEKPVALRSAGTRPGDPRCPAEEETQCATLVLVPTPPFAEANRMPIEIRTPHVRFDHVRIVGAGNADVTRSRAICLSERDRPAGGGLRISSADFTLTGSVVRNVSCYTAIEVTPGADRLVVRDNFIGHNGDHRPGTLWADGLTIHDAADVQVMDNLFVDNTDVQLIFGGCRDCVVSRNRFRHDGGFAGASFAELMLHAWPNTSGDFTGSVVRDNDIDCGVARRCGYGIMLGSNPWYPGRAFGGTVQANSVRHAMVGLNVDALTGPMTITGNDVAASGGLYPSACGTRRWPEVNVAPASRDLAVGMAMEGVENEATAGCLLNQTGR